MINSTNNLKVAFVVLMPFPHWRAHTIYTARMCAAIGSLGAQVRLYHLGGSRLLAKGEDLFEWYGVANSFIPVSIPRFGGDGSGALVQVGHRVSGVWLGASVAAWRPHLCVTSWWNLARVMARLGVNVALEPHGVGQLEEYLGAGTLQRLKQWLAHRDGLPIFCTSYADKESLLKLGVAESRIAYIPLAVAPTKPYSKSQAREMCNLGQRDQIALYSGRFIPGKGVEVLIDAATLMPQVKVVFLGGTDKEVTELKECSKNAHNVKVLGAVPPGRVAIYQSAADVLVIPQDSEIFLSPMKVREYAASGRPIVGTDVAALREVLQDEENALLATAGSPSSLAERITKLMNDDALGLHIAHNAKKSLGSWTWTERATAMLSAAGLSSISASDTTVQSEN